METPVVITKTLNNEIKNPREYIIRQEDIPGFNSLKSTNDFIFQHRLKSWEVYQATPMPTTNDEAWRRTDLRGFKASSLILKPSYEQYVLPPRNLTKPLFGNKQAGQIIQIPGQGTTVNISPDVLNSGVIFTDFKTAQENHPQFLAQSLGQIVKAEDGKFAALASTMAEDGIVVYIPRGVHLRDPLHSIIWSPERNIARFTRLIIWLDDDSELTYVNELSSPNQLNSQSLHAGIVEIYVGEGAHLTFIELQSWGNDVWNFTHERARIDRDGRIDWIFGAMGSRLTKNFSDIDLIGQGATAKMSGFYFTNKDQHLDHDTQQNHLAPNTTSDLLFKGAVKDKSRSVWQGMIYVAPGAQKTDGYQANRNLTLSREARADSIPGLEILANDVRCTHGATVGKLDEEELFYLLSRGIPYTEAVRLIVEGFFEPIMQRIPFEGVRRRFRSIIKRKIR